MSRLIDADKLPEHKFTRESAKGSDYMRGWNDAIDVIVDNEPTVEYPEQITIKCDMEEYKQKLLSALRNVKLKAVVEEARPQGECKTCKYYHSYCEQFSNEPRGDGYCVIARMTPEGLTTINCTDEFGCSDYQEKQGAKNVF